MQFKFYVLNYDFNRKCIVNYNIFNNIKVNEWTEKAIKKYLRSPSKYKYDSLYGFEALCKNIEHIIMGEEWGRCEYEISVGHIFTNKEKELEKWDCYMQTKPNIPIIARECIYQYKKQRKENKVNE